MLSLNTTSGGCIMYSPRFGPAWTLNWEEVTPLLDWHCRAPTRRPQTRPPSRFPRLCSLILWIKGLAVSSSKSSSKDFTIPLLFTVLSH